jgi:hypothetical protein
MASPRYLAACATALLLGLGPVAASAQTVLTMSSWVGPTHLLTKDVLQVWAANVEKATNGGSSPDVAKHPRPRPAPSTRCATAWSTCRT